MIQAQIQFNLTSAQQYFREHLAVGEYYSESEHVRGQWMGKGAAKLRLDGNVGESDFLSLCDGKNPLTGESLRQRINTTREVGSTVRPNRRIFYDFAIAPPKSVSVLALYQDDRILREHERAVGLAMAELEKFAETRLRKLGQRSERRTGNIVAATFRHETSRELDPHLHTHCIVFNTTFDEAESKWTALEVQGMYRAQMFATNLYRHELCRGLNRLGYTIENSERGFEIQGVSSSIIAQFSKRHRQIDQESARRTKIGSESGNLAKLRGKIAHGTRRRKVQHSTSTRLRPLWESQLTAAEKKALKALLEVKPRQAVPVAISEIMDWAEAYLFERRSVAMPFELKSAALEYGRGKDFDAASLDQVIRDRGYVFESGTDRISTRQILGRELAIVTAARSGRNQHVPLAETYAPAESMDQEQRKAAMQILGSRDFITLFRGGAGTGKTFTLREISRGLGTAGIPNRIFAPQRQQVNDLRVNGLTAESISRMLMTKDLPEGCTVIIDEAGQVGGKDLYDVIALVKARKGRIILSGDTRQHGAVQASDALRAIERYGGIKAAEIKKIRRQDPNLGSKKTDRIAIRRYRAAVRAAANGKVLESFDRLDNLGWVVEANANPRRELLTSEYLAAINRKEKVLVVGQTRAESREINQSIRTALLAAGKLGAESIVPSFAPVDLEEAKKRDGRFYHPDYWAHFIHRYGRFQKGDLCEILEANSVGLVLRKNNRTTAVSYLHTDRIAVVLKEELSIARGDRLQLKLNGKSREGVPLSNGELVTVVKVPRHGGLVLEDAQGRRKTLESSQCIFARGYAVTSYASQGKTVDTVLLSDAGNYSATSANQWYVSISRARKTVRVFTSDKTALRELVGRSEERPLAVDLDVPKSAYDFGWSNAHKVIARNRHHREALAAQHVAKIGRTQKL